MSSATATATRSSSSLRTRVQKFGTSLSNMIMPNIAAFIAWGLITMLFIPDGWLPNEGLASMVGPMITFLLPLLIAHSGGRMVYGKRGAVVGVIATMGVIVGTDIPMFIGAMIMGPLGGWSMKKVDAIWAGRIRPGFEMLVNNFSAGIWAGILAVLAFYVIGPVVSSFSNAMANVVELLVENNVLPLTSILIEPAKILFLNNAINHGILTPLGGAQALEAGESILFLLEANPGPGLGLLAAFMWVGRGQAKASAPGAAIIHFLGGIHEIYFPYVLMRPILVLAMIAGGATGVLVNVIFGVGLRAPAAPGSVFAVYAQTARGDFFGVTLALLASAAVAFVVAAFLIRVGKEREDDLSAATADMESMKGKESSVAGALTGTAAIAEAGPIKRIVFACDAGMGSSAMGASVLRRKIHGAGYEDVEVTNKAISDLQDEWDLVVTHQDLTARAQQSTGSAVHVSVDNFMGSPKYDEIVEMIRTQDGEGDEDGGGGASAMAGAGAGAAAGTAVATEPDAEPGTDAWATAEAEPDEEAGEPVLTADRVVLSGTATDRAGAVDEAGNLLVAAGAVDQAYVTAMHDREEVVSTAMGNGLAIPHGTNEAKSLVSRSAMSVIRYDHPLAWDDKEVRYVVGIAGRGNEHVGLLAKIAGIFVDEDQVARLDAATTEEELLAVFDDVVE